MRISDWSSDVCSSDLKQTATLTYVDLIESRNALRFTVAIGGRRLLYCTAGGRVLLASLPDVEQIGRAHVLPPVTNAQLVCRLLLEKKQLRLLVTTDETQLTRKLR